MNKKLVAALVVAGAVTAFWFRAGRPAQAAGDESRHAAHEGHHEMRGGGDAMTCPAHVEGAEVKVDNTKDGVVITITAKDPKTVKEIQVAAAHMGMKHACCAHCGKKASQSSSKKPKEAVYVCSMGCYKGPNTKDGRCPKCGMNLEKR
ncbi:MAG: hypothetical protein HY748_15170 [Elusimicrobia bacterium]|nr:hypothetical protein [Elusimicrobiota bacterium]